MNIRPDIYAFSDHSSLPSIERSTDQSRDLNGMFIAQPRFRVLIGGYTIDCSGSNQVTPDITLLIGLNDLKINVTVRRRWGECCDLVRISIVPDDI